MLFTLLLTAFTTTSGENTHTTVRGRDTCRGEGVTLFTSGVAGSGSQEEGASLIIWTGGHTTGKGDRETTVHTC